MSKNIKHPKTKALRDRRKFLGLCIYCAKKAVKGRQMCSLCRKSHYDARQRYESKFTDAGLRVPRKVPTFNDFLREVGDE